MRAAACINPFKEAAPYRGRRQSGGAGSGRPPRKIIKAHGTRSLLFGRDEIDLSLVSQIVDPSQVRTIGAILDRAGRLSGEESGASLRESLEQLLREIEQKGLGILGADDLAHVRIHEVIAAVNRLRSLQVLRPPEDSSGRAEA